MSGGYHRLLLLFVDGVGLAPASWDNPLARFPSPVVRRLLGGPMTVEQVGRGTDWSLAALDARLGVAGLPQSATGQASLFTGINAARLMGRHVTGLPGPRLRSLVSGDAGLLKRARTMGRRVTFANAYSRAYLARLEGGAARPSVTTCLARSAHVRLRVGADLEQGRAVSWDIVGDLFGRRAAAEGGRVNARAAGQRLGLLAADHDLTLFESFLPDLVGHRRVEMGAAAVVTRFDDLIAGVLDIEDDRRTLLLTSDHGNFESRASRSHTINPVPLLAVGPAASFFAQLESIVDLAPAIHRLFQDAPEVASR